MSSYKVVKAMVPPINRIFSYLQNKKVVQIWLQDVLPMRIEGRIVGFDEFMNMVLDDAVEVHVKKDTRTPVGRILLKGDTISLIMEAPENLE